MSEIVHPFDTYLLTASNETAIVILVNIKSTLENGLNFLMKDIIFIL